MTADLFYTYIYIYTYNDEIVIQKRVKEKSNVLTHSKIQYNMSFIVKAIP